jgi:hypothetical protein
LSPRLREAVVLRYGHGLTYREIADVMGCPQKTADPPKGNRGVTENGTECLGGTEHVTRTGLCNNRSYHQGVTRKGYAIP